MKRLLYALVVMLMIGSTIEASAATAKTPAKPAASAPKQFTPVAQPVQSFTPLDFAAAALAESKKPLSNPTEIEEIEAPQPPPSGGGRHGVAIVTGNQSRVTVEATPSFGTGISPGPAQTFKAEFLSSTTIPPDTMGAVGTTHVVTVSNDRMRILTRDGVEVSRMTLTSFWSGVTIKGAAISAFDPKVYFDRFNNRFILVSSGNGQSVNSGAMFAVSATADPTGTWFRFSVATDPTSTAAGGRWIDYPTVGHNKNWIVVDENVFNFGTAGGGFWGTQIYVLDKQAAYANTLSSISLFSGDFNASCTSGADLACGFTMAPAITEDNTTNTEYMVEDWDNVAGQLRISKLTGTPAAPVITIGTQFPQSTEAWRFDAARINNSTTATVNGTTITSSGGYMPQRQQAANLPSGTRIMANDSRVQNLVLRNGTLWCAHTVMLSATSQPAGTTIGGAGNPIDQHSGIQWWAIDPTNESGGSVAPIQRGRIQDPTADNCHNGIGGQNIIAGRCTSTATQVGEFYAFPNISVNQNNDVFIGFTRFSPLTYPNSAYVIRRSTDAPNTVRDTAVFRPGQANYNIGAGTSTAAFPTNPSRQNRWGDYSAAQTDPINDTDFWSVQEYSGTVRDFGIGLAGNWETWWTRVNPAAPAPSNIPALIISQFRLRGPQGARDEFVELYNPAITPVIVSTTDGSDGWALAYSSNGTTVTAVVAVVPNGTVIPAHGHFLIADNPDAANGPTLVYGLNGYPAGVARTADSDTGWSLDLADNGGVAIFNTANSANFNASTRLDSAGFAPIAAGLFKEGAGIPAVTATTPTGQMTFYRDQSSGTPADTGANENDFIFADPVIETLGVTPRLGAAGPANLDAAVHLTGGSAIVASALDPAVGLGNAPNLFRDPTPGSLSTSTFGTITFRRNFTNNTGNTLPFLRFRIVNITTNPPAGPAADLRGLTSSTGSVSLTVGGPVTVGGTTLETPPAQAVGGGFNSTLNASTVSLATPLASASTIPLQFTAGVQVKGNYNFCLVAEGSFPGTASSVLCFAGTTENTPPSITPSPISATKGAAGTTGTIATVSDAQDSAGSLTVTATSLPTGVTVSSIVNTAGTVTATVAANLTAVSGTNNVTLQVMDSNGATTTATLVVTVIPATPTITPGGPTTFCTGGSVTLTSSAAAGNQWFLNGNPIGGATNQNFLANASGNYTVKVTENATTSAASSATTVTVNPIPATPTITPGGPTTFCTGGSVTLTSSAASGNQWLLNGNPIGGATNQTLVATAAGSYTVTVTASGCTSAASSATVVTVNPIPATPTISGNSSFCTGGNTTLTSSSASGNQWFLNGNPIGGATNQTFVATAAGSYTVTVTASGCTSAASAAKVVTVNPNPNATITAPASVLSGSTGNVASVANAGAGATYTWGITGGTITGGAGTNSITFTAGAVGTLTLNVTVTTGAGCSDTKSANVTVVVPPVTVTSVSPVGGTIAGGSAVTINGTGFLAGASVTFGGSAATNVVVVSSIKITARTPAHALGAVNVTVTNTNTATGTLINGYLYKAQQFDPNNDGTISAMDIFYLINYLYMSGPPPAGAAGLLSGDANGDGVVNPLDIFYLINYLFLGGPRPNAVTPHVITEAAGVEAPHISGSVVLGKAALRDGHYVVPVIMTTQAGSAAPQAMSLRVHFEGEVGKVTIAKAGAAKDLKVAFETNNQTGNDLSYLVSYGNLTLGASRSAVVAEIEIEAGSNVALRLDPQLTMLSDQSGSMSATVANGKLQVNGTTIGSGATPRPRTPGSEVN